MVGRKLALSPSVIMDAVLYFKEKVISIDEDGKKSKLSIILYNFNFICKYLLYLSLFFLYLICKHRINSGL